ncbi:hypothetical protein N1851_030464 [Merluccius polli]|uniref:Uncharacterized protein n=1 Tax=Merluccius polli TaxID=89951 RepID=A0AA47M5E4_MERPO|nr:hypothetical protein N1851_030464 [Merluccius polli]
MDFRKTKCGTQTSIHINGTEVERVTSFKFLGVHICGHPNPGQEAHQRLLFLRTLKKVHLSHQILRILTNCITIWYGNWDRKALQRVVKTAQCITGSSLHSIKAVQQKRYLRCAALSRTVLTPATDCFTYSPLGGVTGLCIPEPAGSRTASSLRLSPC